MKLCLAILSVFFTIFCLIVFAPATKADETTTWKVDWYEVLTDTGTFGNYLGTQYWYSGEFDRNWGDGVLYGGRTNYTGFKATAWVYVASDRYVLITIGSDDGSRLYVDSDLIIDHWGTHRYSTRSSYIYLTKGKHLLELHYYEWTGDARVSFAVDDDSILQQSSPILFSGSVSPTSGTVDTTFTFEVVYTDADGAEASYVYVTVSGQQYLMTRSIGEPTTGVLYRYSTTGRDLQRGANYYYFYASDGIDTVWLPTSGTFSGPTVANRQPVLSSGGVSPSSGAVGTTFTYEVTYADADGDPPLYVNVYIDGIAYSMDKVSGTYTGGAIYRYTTTLGGGSHSYYFQASDGIDTVTTTTYYGPIINRAPTLTSGSVSPYSGDTATLFTYEVLYTDADGDAPSYVYVYIDGIAYSMARVSGTYTGGAIYRYTTTLGGGSHSYYFQASDGIDTVTTTTYYGPTITTPSIEVPGGGGGGGAGSLAIVAVLLVMGGVGGGLAIARKKRLLVAKPKSAGLKMESPSKRAPAKPAGMFCTHCKLELPADAEFCPECGRGLKRR